MNLFWAIPRSKALTVKVGNQFRVRRHSWYALHALTLEGVLTNVKDLQEDVGDFVVLRLEPNMEQVLLEAMSGMFGISTSYDMTVKEVIEP